MWCEQYIPALYPQYLVGDCLCEASNDYSPTYVVLYTANCFCVYETNKKLTYRTTCLTLAINVE